MKLLRVLYLPILMILAVSFFHSCGGEMSGELDILSYMDWDVISGIKSEDFPDYDAVVLLKRKEHLTSIFEGGSETKITEITSIKILSEKGMQDLGIYTSEVLGEGTKYLVEAVVIDPDGTRRVVGGGNVKRINVGKKFFFYRVALPGLEVGSVICIRETVSVSKVGGLPIISGEWDFASKYYTLHSELVLKMPAGMKMKFVFTPRESEVEPVVEDTRKYKIYRFAMDNLPPFEGESLMPKEFVNNPSVRYFPFELDIIVLDLQKGTMEKGTYVANWKNALDYVIDYFDPELWEGFEWSKVFSDELDKIIDTMKTKVDTSSLDEVVEYFHSNFKPVENVYLTVSSFVPSAVFLEREGDPFSLAYALYRILNKLGYSADVILLRDQNLGEADRRVISAGQFNHPIIIVRDKENEYAIDPASEFLGVNQLPWNCQGVKGVEITPRRDFFFVTSPVYPCDTNSIIRIDTLTVDEGGSIRGKARITLCGQPLYNLWQKAGTKELNGESEPVKSFVKEVFPMTFSCGDISTRSNGRDSLTIEFDYSSVSAFQVVGSLMNIDFSAWLYTPYLSTFSTEKRRFDVLFHHPMVVETSIVIRLPDGYGLFQNVKEFSGENEFFGYERVCSASGDELHFRRVFKILKKRIGLKDYNPAREFLNRVKLCDRENVVLKRF